MTDYLGLPPLASEHGARIDEVNLYVHLVMAVALVIWGAFFIIPLVKYRRGRHPRAKYRGLKTRMPYVLVFLMAAAEAVLLLGLSLPFWESHVVAEPDPSIEPYRVRVIARQFSWSVHYPGPDGVFGRTDIHLMDDQVNPIGFDPDDPFGKDDLYQLNWLYVPVNRLVLVELTSLDVIHSFALPELRVKQDAIPGMSIPVRFTPTMTSTELQALEGDEFREFEIVCSQLCGLTHYRMRGFMKVLPDDELAAWYATELENKVDAW